MSGILVKLGCSEDAFLTVPANRIHRTAAATATQKAAAGVGQQILQQATEYVQHELQQAEAKVLESLSPTGTDMERKTALDSNEQVEHWRQALLRLEGEDNHQNSSPWQYVFIDSPVPQAFVTELLPRRFFISTGLLQQISQSQHPNDELALLLGHEMAHLLLGHTSARNQVEFAVRTAEVLLLSVDPTAGLLSMVFMSIVYAVRRAVTAAHSRENETAADRLGLELAAAACFDTKKGARILETLHHSTTTSTSNFATGWLDSHPPTLERYHKMLEHAETVNYKRHAKCMTLSRRLHDAWWGS